MRAALSVIGEDSEVARRWAYLIADTCTAALPTVTAKEVRAAMRKVLPSVIQIDASSRVFTRTETANG